MTLFVFPDPSAAVKSLLEGAASTRWPTATISMSVPSESITAPHIQHAWDGTPSEQSNQQSCTIRVTCWAPKAGGVQMTTAKNLAQLVRAFLLDSGSATVWRFARGARGARGPGPLPGIDPDTGLPFCTFNLTAETRPTVVA